MGRVERLGTACCTWREDDANVWRESCSERPITASTCCWTCADRLEVVNIMSASGRSAYESGRQHGFAYIGVCTEYLVYSEILKEQRHEAGKGSEAVQVMVSA